MIEKREKNPDSDGLHFLIELRTRLIYSLIFLFLFFAILLYYANDLYTLLAFPLLKFLPSGHLIATQIVSPFFVPFQLAFTCAFLFSIPFFFYQFWIFISPALYGYERRIIWPFLFLSLFLFYLGLLFAYFVILPMLFHFLSGIAPKGVVMSPDIGEYLNFTMKLLLIFGGLFEIPMLMVILVSCQLVSLPRLIKMRSYAILGSFIIGMLLAPPDILSQTTLAIPIWLLYEIGLLLARLVGKNKYEKNESVPD
jgi:sec-independent protein translocase protein TatC